MTLAPRAIKNFLLLACLTGVPGSVHGALRTTIAILDTGIDETTRHQYSARLEESWDARTQRPIPSPNASAGSDPVTTGSHGTRILQEAAKSCAECRLLPIRVTQHGGDAQPDIVAKGIQHALKRGARVINVSLGLTRTSPELRQALKAVERARAVLVVAAGRGVENPFKPTPLDQLHPQSSPQAIVVGVDRPNTPESAVANTGPELDLLASAESSSIAAGMISGFAGKALAAHPELNSADVRYLLRENTRPPTSTALNQTGYGTFDAEKFELALKEALPHRKKAPITYRSYTRAEGKKLVDLNSARDILGARLCDRKPAPVTLSFEAQKKGRARLTFDVPASVNRLQICLILPGGSVHSLALTF